MKKLPKYFNSQGGVIPIIVLVASIALISFLVITNTFSFKSGLFSSLFPKPPSNAAGSTTNTCGSLNLTSTFNSIGIEVAGNTAASASLRFKKTSDTSWRNGLPLWQAGGSLYGSALLLSDNTSYDIEVTPAGGSALTCSITTRQDNIPAVSSLNTTHYVDATTGNDTTGNGSVSSPWKTISKAVSSAPANSVIEVGPGYFTGMGSVSTSLTIKAKYPAVDDSRNIINQGQHSVIDSGHISTPGSGKWVSAGSCNGATIWEWPASGVSNPQNLGYAATRDALPIRVGRWDAKTGTSTPAEWMTNMCAATIYNYGFYTAGQDIYIRIPGDIDPNTQYVTLGGGIGMGATVSASNVRISGFEVRQGEACITLGTAATFGVIDHNLLNGCGASGGVQLLGTVGTTAAPASTYGSDHVIQYNKVVDSSLWTNVPWSGGQKADKYVIPWNFIKGTPGGALSSNRYGQASETTAIHSKGGAHRVVIRYNTFDGSFNGVGGYNKKYDKYAAQDQDIHDNFFIHMADDGLEPESQTSASTESPPNLASGIINWRIWNNKLQQTYTVLSTGPVFYGPVYLFKNQAWETAQNFNDVWGGGVMFKYSGTSNPAARVYVINNTLWTDNYNPATALGVSGGAQNAGGGANTEKFYLRNNIMRDARYVWESAPLNTTGGSYLNWDENNNQFATSDDANPSLTSKRGLQYGGTKYTTNVGAYQSAYQSTSGVPTTTNVLFNAAAGTGHFVDTNMIDSNLNNVTIGLTAGDLTGKNNVFTDKGVVIPNIADLPGFNYQGSAPDLGACEGTNCLAAVGGSGGSATPPPSASSSPTNPPTSSPTPTPAATPAVTTSPSPTPPVGGNLVTVNITSPTNGSTVSGNVNVTTTVSAGVVKVEFYVDGAIQKIVYAPPFSYAWDSTTVANGSHSIRAQAYDSLSNITTSSISVNVANADVTPPSAPTNLTAIAASYNKVNLSWTASTDNVGVVGYYVVRNGVTLATSSSNSYSDSSVTATTTYNYQVIAFDGASNNSAASNTATVTTPPAPDVQAPTAPTNLTAQAASSSQINLTWGASTDNVGVVGYDVYRDSTKIATVGATTLSFGDTGLSASTTHSYFVKAFDGASPANVSAASNTATATTQAPPVVNGSISGTVYSSLAGTISWASVSVVVNGATQTYAANSVGQYYIPNLVPSAYSVTYSAKFYQAQTLTTAVGNGQNVVQNVTLQTKKRK